MHKRFLENRILDLLRIYIKLLDAENQQINLSEDEKNEFNELWRSIIEDLMWEPGKLIYIKDSEKINAYKTMIDIIWKTHDSEEIFDELQSGGYSGLMLDIVENYVDSNKTILRDTVFILKMINCFVILSF